MARTQVAEAKAAELESFDTVLVKEHQLSPSKRSAKGKEKEPAQGQSNDDAMDQVTGTPWRWPSSDLMTCVRH
jgi:hypothetical protein